MHRTALIIAATTLLALPATAPAADPEPGDTLVRFTTTCAAIVVAEAQELVETGRPSTIACPL